MKIDAIPIDDLKLAEYNPRTISPHDFRELKRSIKENGWLAPVVANQHPGRENVVISGHQRIRAARELGHPTVPVYYVAVDPDTEKALNIALNRISGTFTPDGLAAVLKTIEKPAIIERTGLTQKELDRMLYAEGYLGTGDEDEFSLEAARADSPTRTRPGDVIDLGPHRLACGDARDPDLLKKLVGTEKIDMLFTDPPYNVDYQGGRLGKIMNDAQAPEEFQGLLTAAFKNAFGAMKAGGVFYICMGWSGYPALMQALRPCDVHFSNVIMWIKDNAAMGFNDYHYKHELVVTGDNAKPDPKGEAIAYGWKAGTHYFAPLRDQADVWFIRRRNPRQYVHPTQKPIGLITKAMNNSTRTGESVLDPFGGSGSTLMAADLIGRRAFLIEADPKYCDVIRKRYEQAQEAKEKAE